MKRLLSKLLIGKRMIMFRSGYTNTGKGCHVCIGIISSIYKKNKLFSYEVGIDQYGYDVNEWDYSVGAYTWGCYPLKDVINILLAQKLLRKQFSGVDINLNRDVFYESEKLISQIKQ